MQKIKFLLLCSLFIVFTSFAHAQSAFPEEDVIGLQNLRNRNVVRCYGGVTSSAEDCARYYEEKGYVRFRDIPSKTAKYDFLKVDTFPTRRWRNNESTPRW